MDAHTHSYLENKGRVLPAVNARIYHNTNYQPQVYTTLS